VKTTIYIITDTDAQKREERTGLDTLVVHAVTDEYWLLEIFFINLANALNIPPGDYNRKIETQRNWLRFVQAVEHVV
jgi:hypothetical protein